MTGLLNDNDAFLALASRKLLPVAPDHVASDHRQVRGDHSLQVGSQQPYVRSGEPKPAVVLVPILRRREPTVLFTVRSETLRQHSGQVAFPGGRIDDTDQTVFEAALREADEEIGLAPEYVSPIGYLDSYLSGTNYLVLPVVASVEPGFRLTLNPAEVTDTFEVPLAVLMDPARHELHSRIFAGVKRYFYAISYEDRYIWGVTAGIIHNMYERLFGP